MTARLSEKRRDKRIDVALPVILENATGVTRDVSASGMFFWISGTYALGDSISFSMGRKTESGKFMLKCRGVVFRTEPRDKRMGVAMRITEPVVEPT
ncbi:MAG: PilZ domain-containing protein [Betaproteobacteria bacterium]|nr:PilZ domain-containing protein [Betaproteobacteria bacterium]MDH3468846.1 PilZ domain-containing protein [Gammaproteobacteria bacterium]